MIYLDNCATTKMRKEVLDNIYRSMEENFANPSSLHELGLKSEKAIKSSRETIASYMGVDGKEIYFTSGGTESNNIAIQSIAKSLKKRGNHIITSKIEHSSVKNIMKDLERQGFKVTYLDVDSKGMVDLDSLKESINDGTILVSIIYVNNEIGTIQNIKEIKRTIEQKNIDTLLHVDAVQAFGKIDFQVKSLGIDTLSISSHKIHGPKGTGALYVNKDLNLDPIVFGGKQERGLRSGTENVSGIIAFGKAVELMAENKQEEREKVYKIKQYTMDKIKKEIKDIKINSQLGNNFSPYILNISIRDTRGEVLLHYLEQDEIYISTSSACSSHDTKKSDVLKSIGLNDNEIEGTIRICFSYDTSYDDIDKFVKSLKRSVEEIRKIILR